MSQLSNIFIPQFSKSVFSIIPLFGLTSIAFITIWITPIDLISILALLFGAFSLLFFSLLSPSAIVKTIFWATFINMFVDMGVIRHYVFDLHDAGYSTRINWFSDALLFVLVLRLVGAKKNRKYFFGFNLFTFILFITALSSIIYMESVTYSFLSLRVIYTFILLAYVIYIYDFSEKEYEKYFKLFLSLAVLNSVISILQFAFQDLLDFSNQMAGGIFGYHGTGLSAIFSVIQSSLCIQIFLKRRKTIYLFLSILIAIPIITGYAYGGFVFMIMAITIISFSSIKTFSFIKIFKSITIGLLIFSSIFFLAKNIQSKSAFKSYYSIFTNTKQLSNLLIKNYAGDTAIYNSLGRVGSVIFAYKSISQNRLSFWLGYGPGSASYRGYTTKNSSSFLDKTGFKGFATLMQAYIYELGIWGLFFLITVFYLIYIKWKKTKNPNYGISRYYFSNIVVLIPVYFLSTIYTHTLANSFMTIFFAINLSYINHCHRNQKISIKKL